MWFRNLMGRKKPAVRKPDPGRSTLRASRRRSFQLEPLEERTLLDVGAAFQFADGLLEQFDAKASRIDFGLFAASEQYQAAGGAAVQIDSSLVTQLGDMVVIDATASADPSLLVQELTNLGAQITGTWQQTVSALVPLAALDQLESLSNLAFARSAATLNNVGLTDSQGDASMQSDLLRNFFGLDGAGQTVGVLSDSYDSLGGAAADVASGDLPGPGNPNGYTTAVNVIQDGGGGLTDEGRGMLQLVHDVVPAANLAFATAWLGQASFATNIGALATAGATVITDDIIYYDEPMFSDGGIAQAVDNVVAAGIPYFSSAGNTDRLSYEANWVNSGSTIDIGFGPQPAHDFDPGAGVDIFQQITVPVNTGVTIEFQWPDPFLSWTTPATGAANDYDIILVDDNPGGPSTVLASSNAANIGSDPVERIWFFNNGTYDYDGVPGPDTTFNISILEWSAPSASLLKTVFFFTGGGAINEYNTNSSTAYGHNNAAGASAVGAAYYKQTPEFGTSPPVLEGFSSAGAPAIYFDTAGNPIGPVVRQTPDIVAPDGTNTTFFGSADPSPGGPFEADGYPNFFGTSAAAPHAAALAAQLMQANPALTPAQVYSSLETTAIDMGPAGYDADSGWGLVEGLGALSNAGGPYSVTFDGDSGDNNMVVQLDSGGTNVEFWLDGSLEMTFPLVDISDITVNGLAGDDQLTVDFGFGNPIPGGGITYNGGTNGAGGDTLKLDNGAATNVTHRFDNANDGQVNIDGSTVDYTGLEPITDNLNVANRVFTFTLPVSNGTLTTSPAIPATHTRIDSNASEWVDFTTPTSSLTVNLAAGGNTFSVNSLANNYNTPANTINGNSGDDVVNFEVTDGSAAAGAQPWTVNGAGGDDTVNLSPVAMDLDNLDDGIVFNGGGGTNDTLNVRDDNQPGGDTFTVTSTTIDRLFWADDANPGVTYDAAVEAVNLVTTGGGADTINVNSTSATATTTIESNGGDDVFNIDATNLGGQNFFRGGDGDDTFNVNITGSGGISAPLEIQGNANDFGGGVGSRDQVIINDNFGLGVVPVTMTYTGGAGGSELVVTGLTSTLTVQTAETVAYRGDAGDNDQVTVVGTAGADDLLTAAPISNSRVLVFNNDPADSSGPFNGPPENFATRIPGVSGGSVRPDLDLGGVSSTSGLQLQDAGGTGDRVYVYGRSEAALNDGNTFDPFGFGAGNILPAVANPTAYDDTIYVFDQYTRIDTPSLLFYVRYSTTDFAQTTPSGIPAVVVNSGFESNAPVADRIRAFPSASYAFQINGGDPDPGTTGIVPPDGDRLEITGLYASADIYSDKSTPRNVTLQLSGGVLPIWYSSIENVQVSATSVNLVGDNNDAAVDQNDNFVVIGQDIDGNPADGGYQEMSIQINGAGWINVDQVQFLNVLGDDSAGTPSAGPNDVDSLEITPYADNTPRGWGVDVRFDEGNPALDGDQQPDLLIYNGVPGVSEEIIVSPSGPGAGQLIVNNAATGTPIVTIDYTTNTGIVINGNDGSAGDTDTLTLLGTDGTTPLTSGDETVVVDFDAAGTSADPYVQVSDSAVGGPAGILYQIIGLTNIETVNFDLSDGDDVATIRTPAGATYSAGVEYLNVSGGKGNDQLTVDVNGRDLAHNAAISFEGGEGNDQLVFSGTPTNAINSVYYSVGAAAGSGTVQIDDGTAPAMQVDFTGLEPVVSLLPTTSLVVNATAADNAITYDFSPLSPFGGVWGRVSIDSAEALHFANATNLAINALGGDDTITLANPTLPTGLTGTVTVDGGDPPGSDTLVMAAVAGVADALVVTPLGQGAGNVASSAGVNAPAAFTNIEQLELVGQQADGDWVSVEGTTGDDEFQYISGPAPDAGQILGAMDRAGATAAGPFPLVPISFRGMDHSAPFVVNAAPGPVGGDDMFVFVGTDTNDNISVVAGPGTSTTITNTVNSGIHAYVQVDNIGDLVVESGQGDDTLTVAGNVTVRTAIRGGDPSASDTLTLIGTTATVENVTIGPDWSDSTVQLITGFANDLAISGVELITYLGADGDDSLTVRPGQGDHDVRVQNAAVFFTDLVTSDALPDIQFAGVQDFIIDQAGSIGNIRATFVTRGLAGAVNYQTILDNEDTLIIEGSDGQADSFTVIDPVGTPVVAVTDNTSGITVTDLGTGVISPLGRLQIDTLGGDDLIVVDDSSGLITVPITVDGGANSDTLLVTGSTAVEQVEYLPGPDVLEGRLAYSASWGPPPSRDMVIDFANMEPVIDLVPKTVALTVYGTNADNAINYTAGPHSGVVDPVLNPAGWTTGLVSVDGYETVEFANFTGADDVLEIIGQAGDDVVNLNNSGPAPAGLERIWVEGNDPTASDEVIVNGTTDEDTIGVSLLGADSATVTGVQGVTQVDVRTAELLVINGRGGADDLTVVTPTGEDALSLTPGSEPDSGSIATRELGGGTLRLPIEFLGLEAFGSITFDDAGGVRDDTLQLHGTSADDVFNVQNDGSMQIRRADHVLFTTVDVQTPGVGWTYLLGHDGDDEFNVAGDHPFFELRVQGGNPSASDVLNFTSSGGNVTVDLAAQTVAESGFSPVIYSGVELVDVDTSGGALTVSGTVGDDRLEVTPLTANTGVISGGALLPVVHYANVSGNAITVDAAGGEDTVVVNGTSTGETLTVSGTQVVVSGQTVNFTAEALTVNGLQGDDTFDVTPSATVPIFIDGGDPIGTTPGDQINFLPPAGPVTYEAGPESDEGALIGAGTERVSFDHIEGISFPPGAGPVLIVGTNGDDDITVIARDASTHPSPPFPAPGADGVQDFTVSVNGGAELLFLDVSDLYIDALAGDDDIVIRTPAPNDAEWDVDVWVAGGTPAASDRLVLETPGNDTVVFTPTGTDTGTVLIDEAVNDSLITIGPFTLVAGPFSYTSSPGGVEHFIYDGQAGNDALTVNGTTGDNTIVHTAAVAPDEGSLVVDSLLPISYEDLGLGGGVTVDGLDGSDLLVYLGTDGTDTIRVPAASVAAPSVDMNNHIGLATTGVERYMLRGLGGDDRFEITALDGVAIEAQGDEPGSGSDVLDFSGSGAAITLDLDALTITETGLSAVDFSGFEQVNIDAATADVTVTGTPTDDAIAYQPTGTNAGQLQLAGLATVFNLDDVGDLTIDPSGGVDRVEVSGNADDNSLTVALGATSTVTVDTLQSAQVVLAAGETLAVVSGEGDDQFVVSGSGGPKLSLDGGQPVASDTLLLTVPSVLTIVQGADPTTGEISAAGMSNISFTGLEIIYVDSLTVDSTLVVFATDADDVIVLDSLDGNTQGAIFVNAGPTIVFDGLAATGDFATVALNSLAGDDRVQVDPLAQVSINVDGGAPSASDEVVVIAPANTVVNGLGNDQATVTVTGFSAIQVDDVELLTIDAEAGDIALTVEGTTGNDMIVHTPGTAADEGLLQVNSLLPVAYQDLGLAGTVVVDGLDGADTLSALGTAGSDAISVAFTATNAAVIGLVDAAGSHVALTSSNVESYAVRALEGDDNVAVQAPIDIDGVLAVFGGGPSGSDSLQVTGAAGQSETVYILPDAANSLDQDINGLGAPIDVSGVELIAFAGQSADPDDLIVDPGSGDHTLRVDNSSVIGVDRVVSDSLPEVQFGGFRGFEIFQPTVSSGSIVATFVTSNLEGAQSYTTDLETESTLVIEGRDGQADSFTVVTSPFTYSVSVTDNVSGITVSDLVSSTDVGRLQIDTLGGDDLIVVDDSSGLITVPITVDGGANSDTLLVTGSTAVEQVEYLPGPDVLEGRLAYSASWGPPPSRDMVIDFANMEPVIDLVPKTVALTVYGTNADNAINYTAGPHSGVVDPVLNPAGWSTGLVSVDGYETVEFANFTGEDDVLEIIGQAGDDVVNLNNSGPAPAGLERIWVEGSDPTASDEVIVNGTTGDDTIDVSLLAADSATVTGVQNVLQVDVRTAELLVINGQGGADDLTVVTPTGEDALSVTPGSEPDSGSIATRQLGGGTLRLPIEFLGLGAFGSITFDDAGGVRDDTLELHGTAAGDVFSVQNDGSMQIRRADHVLFTTVDLQTPGVGWVDLLGHEGDDVFEVPGDHPFSGLMVQGGGPGASDVLDFTGSGGAVSVDLDAQTVAEAGFSPVEYRGVEQVDVYTSGGALTVAGTVGDDRLEVTPLTANTGVISGGALLPVVHYANVSGNAITVDAAGGEDTVVVNGTSTGETLTVSGTQVVVSGQTVNFTAEALTVNGLQGDDTFDVTPSTTVPIFIDGGDPIGVTPGDQINFLPPVGPVTYEAGPESDEGALIAAAHERVSFDHIEGINVAPGAGPVLVLGTNADDDITVIARDASTHPSPPVPAPGADGVQDFTISVNAGPDVLFLDVSDLYIDALAGDDDIVIRTPAPNDAEWDVDVWVAGGTPAASDRLVLETPGNDTVVFTPTGTDTGTVLIDEAVNDSLITIGPFTLVAGPFTYISSPGGVEHFIYDGQAGDDNLTVVGTQGNDRIVHTPGNEVDSGQMVVNSFLPLSYEDLGAGGDVTADGGGGEIDTLVALGTGDSDRMDVLFTGLNAIDIDLSSAAGTHVDLLSVDIQSYELRTLEGDDRIDVTAPINADGSLAVFGGGPGDSDSLRLTGDSTTASSVTIAPDAAESLDQDVTGLGAPIDVSGMELIAFAGANRGDSLTVNVGPGGTEARVEGGNDGDQVTSDSLPKIEFKDLDTFLLDVTGSASTRAVFATHALSGAANYQVDGVQNDTLVIEGADGLGDSFRVTDPDGAGPTAVEVTDNLVGVAVTEPNGNLGRLELATLGDDDQVTVDVGSADVVRVPITFDGGAGRDILWVIGTPVSTVDVVDYTPGPAVNQGRLGYWQDLGGGFFALQMQIDIVNLEPVIDLVPAATLSVWGTNADNAINYQAGSAATRGKVTVDAYEGIEFDNKGTLELYGQAGDDVINLNNPTVPTGLTAIDVEGGDPTGSDRLVVNATSAADTIIFSPTGEDSGSVSVAGLPTVTFDTTERVVIDGQGGNDFLQVSTPGTNETITLTPATAPDAGTVEVVTPTESLVPMDFQTVGTGATLHFLDAAGTDQLIYNGTAASDHFVVGAAAIGLNNRIIATTSGIDSYRLRGLGGDDTMDVIPMVGIDVFAEGDEPGASDTLNYMRNVAGPPQVIVDLDATPGGGFVQQIQQPGYGFVQFSGMEMANIDALTADLYVSGTRNDDVITFTPLSTEGGRFTAAGIPTTFLFAGVPEATNSFTITGGGTGFGGPAGGGFADQVIYNGTGGSDLIRVDSPNRTVSLDVLGFGFPPVAVASWRSVVLDDGTSPFGTPGVIEVINVNGNYGNDTFFVVPGAPVGNGLYVNVDGGSPQASDALVITNLDAAGNAVPLAVTDFVVVGQSRNPDAGNILVYQSAARRPNIAYENVEVVSPNVTDGDHLLILGPDMFEQNEYRQTAADLGTADVLNVENLAIFPNANEHPGVPADQDWFKVKAEVTGLLDIQISFRTFPTALLPEGGQLGLEVTDATGTVIGGDGVMVGGIATRFGAYDGDPDARVRIPAVAGQTYYIRVFGQTGTAPFINAPLVVNGYDMTIVNEAAPVPYDLELRDIIEQGSVVLPVSTTVLRGNAALSNVDDFYNGKYLTFLIDPGNGILQVQRRLITDYVGVTRQFTLANPLPAVPAVGDTFQIESFDTGRSQLDDYTRDSTPIIYLRVDDAGLLYDLPGNTSADSPTDEPIRIPFNTDQTLDTSTPGYRVAVFVEGEPQQPGAEPQEVIGFARAVDIDLDGQPDGIYVFDFGSDAIDPGNPNGPTTAFTLTDGSHFISAKVQIVDPDDPDDNPATLDNLTAFGARSDSLEIVVDTVPPPAVFGYPAVVDVAATTNVNEADGLHPDSDTGVQGLTATFSDNITSDTTPTLWGVAEANALVRVYADANQNATLEPWIDHFLGETVALPLDGTNQFLGGQWTLTTNIDLNDPAYFPARDGVRTLFVTGADVASNVTDPVNADVLQIFVDTQGPQVADPDGDGPLGAIHITDDPTTAFNEATFDLFDPKPSEAILPNHGPTPLVNALTINFQDLPSRILQSPLFPEALLNWDYDALASVTGNGDPASDPGLFQVVGDANGIIPILRVELTNNPLGPNTLGSVIAGADPSTFTGNAALSTQDHVYEGQLLRFTGGALTGQARVITGYDGDTRQFVFDTPFGAVPAAGDSFVIFPPATASITLVFRDPGTDGLFNTLDDIGAPLPDDRFTLSISDELVDPVGNNLDGQSNATQPLEDPQFPSGDGQTGGDFTARFTVDSRPELGTWSAGSVYVDTNGNFVFDPTNADHVNRDITYVLGFASDDVFVGNFAFDFGPDGLPFTPDDGVAVADGFDKLGAYGQDTTGRPRWVIDVDNDGVTEIQTLEPLPFPAGFDGVGHPVAGNFDGDATNGDEIGLFDGISWWLDTDRDFTVSDNAPLTPGLRGYPIVGDFDGDGLDDLATYLNGTFSFDLAAIGGLGNAIDATLDFSDPFLSFIGARERPVAADYNQDGVDDIGLWVPDRSGQTPGEGGEWYLIISTPTAANPQVNPAGSLDWLDHEFEPVPFGNDLFARFGDEFAAPIFGNLDPPPALVATAGSTTGAVLSGTAGNDQIEFHAAAAGQWTITINGTPHYVGADVTELRFDGLGGRDSITIFGTSADETVEAWAGHAVFQTNGYTVQTTNVEQLTAYSGGGSDVATLHNDPASADKLQATPAYATIQYGGGAARNHVGGFRQVIATGDGTIDSAKLYDDPSGDDTFVGTPEYGELFGSNYYVRAEGFRWVGAFARGGDDAAQLYDKADAKEFFVAKADYARLAGSSFSNYLKGFDEVTAYSTGGGDGAYLYDDPAATEAFTSNRDEATLAGKDHSSRAVGFARVSAYSFGGNDTAELYDTPGVADRFMATPEYGVMYGSGFYSRAWGFVQLQAFASGDGDIARLYDDAAGDDMFAASPAGGTLIGAGFEVGASGFRWLTAYSRGGTDVAVLNDSQGNDVFVGRPEMSSLRGANFYLGASAFDTVRAYSTAGGVDVAQLYDAALTDMPDQLRAADNWAEISNPLLGYSIWVSDFEQVEAHSSNSGDTEDVADAVDWLLAYGWDN